ncbi:cupin domain-containing protein [Cognatiyoonia sp. IB215182]|uniref:cupin domain-containing protein n=1 Tax=Cognatiyoonia sp. IB215182 TaxID=3097353 RepID=UPI002A0E4FFE|nr:cupin domain-containing protein [Cognatiyoonia sp. IB215182]MDX8352257.1 cupin domain-containing protein [Cognatiyoonia sp. IB215182]
MAENSLVWHAPDIAATRFRFRHPLDQDADITMFPLAHAAGLARASVTLAHLSPGQTSFPKHRHYHEEEWVYIISGTGRLEMDNDTHVMHEGSFAAFPAGGPAHKLTNDGDVQLVYLMGGDRQEVEIVDFTDAGKRMTRVGEGPTMTAEMAPIEQFASFDFMSRADEDG